MPEDDWSHWAQDMIKRLENTPLGDSLRRSPAWQKSMENFSSWFTDRETGRFRFVIEGLDKFADRWRPEGGWKSALAELGGIRMSDLSLPSLPRPDLGWSGPSAWAPPLPGGSFSPALPTAPSPAGGMAAAQVLLVILVVALLIVVFWRLARKRSLTLHASAAARALALGDWPVDPARVANRDEIVQAFEYLSLLRLGPEVRSLNHCALALELGDATSEFAVAEELAHLYEQARYTPAGEPISSADLERARRGLCLLGGVRDA
jgi:hypothetical protein